MRELARKSGLSAAQISRIENGSVEQPSVRTLINLAVALGRDSELLLIAAGHTRGAEARGTLRRWASLLPAPRRDYVESRIAIVESAEAALRHEAEVKEARLAELRTSLAEEEETISSLRRRIVESQRTLEAAPPKTSDESVEDDSTNKRLTMLDWLKAMVAYESEQVEEARERRRKLEEEFAVDTEELTSLRRQIEEIEAESELIRVAGSLFVESPGAPRTAGTTTQAPAGSGPADLDVAVKVFSAETARLVHEIRNKLAHSAGSNSTTHGTRSVTESIDRQLNQLQRGLAISLKELEASSDLGDEEFREIRRRWPALEPGRRRKVLEFVKDQHALSVETREARRILAAETPEEAFSIGDEASAFYGLDDAEGGDANRD
jgi:transcriptional regulator with XRE-family HTH domain